MANVRRISHPPIAKQIAVADVVFAPGDGHSFHKHPDQEEVIYVVAGELEQWVEREKLILGPGDSVFIPPDTVHALFNNIEGDTKFLAIFGPCVGANGWETIDVADQKPWQGLRPISN